MSGLLFPFAFFRSVAGILLLVRHGRNIDAHLVEKQHGQGHEALGEDVRRGENGGHDEDDQYGVTPCAAHELGGEQAEARKKIREQRHFEHQSEGDEELERKAEVFLHRYHGHDGFRGEAHEELEGDGEHQEEAERRARQEEDGGEEGQRQYRPPFLTVQARRDEGPELIEAEGTRAEQRGHEGHLHIGEEGSLRRGVDELAALRHTGLKRGGKEGVQRFGYAVERHEAEKNDDDDAEKPTPEFVEMPHDAHGHVVFRAFLLVLFGFFLLFL